MSYRNVLNKMGFDDASANKMVGSSTLGYKQTLENITDKQIEDSLYTYNSGMGELPCLVLSGPKSHIQLIGKTKGGEAFTKIVPLVKSSMSKVAQFTLKDWSTADLMTSSLAEGVGVDVKVTSSAIATEKIPNEMGPKGSRKDAFDYLQKYGLIRVEQGAARSAKGMTLFYDPPIPGEKKEAFVITKELQINGNPFTVTSKSGVVNPGVVHVSAKTALATYLAICKELGLPLSNIPVLITVLNAESNLTLNQHRLELGQVLNGTWKGLDATKATTFGLTQVQPVGLEKSPYFAKAMGLLGVDSYPKLDSFVWNSLSHSLMAGLLYHLLYIETCATASRSVFLRYAGQGSKMEAQLNSGALPTKWGWNIYSDLLRRVITERSVAWYLQNK